MKGEIVRPTLLAFITAQYIHSAKNATARCTLLSTLWQLRILKMRLTCMLHPNPGCLDTFEGLEFLNLVVSLNALDS